MSDVQQEGFISEEELTSELCKKINNADVNGKNAKISMGMLANLNTDDKSSLVNAINEVNAKLDKLLNSKGV